MTETFYGGQPGRFTNTTLDASRMNAEQDRIQAEIELRDRHLTGHYSAPVLAVVAADAIVVTEAFAGIVQGVRPSWYQVWGPFTGWDAGTYYLQVGTDGLAVANTTADPDALTVGTVAWSGTVLSTLTPVTELLTSPVATGNATSIQGVPVSTTAPADGQVIKFNAGTGQYEPAADAVLTAEEVQDLVGAMFPDSGGLDWTYNDTDGVLTATIPAGLTQEQVEDIVGALVVAGADVSVSYDDETGELSIAFTGGTGGGDLTLTISPVSGIARTVLAVGVQGGDGGSFVLKTGDGVNDYLTLPNADGCCLLRAEITLIDSYHVLIAAYTLRALLARAAAPVGTGVWEVISETLVTHYDTGTPYGQAGPVELITPYLQDGYPAYGILTLGATANNYYALRAAATIELTLVSTT